MNAQIFSQFNRIRRLEIELELTQVCDALIADLKVALENGNTKNIRDLMSAVTSNEKKLKHHINTCLIPVNCYMSKANPRFDKNIKGIATNHLNRPRHIKWAENTMSCPL